jgi:hypothetical protein
MHFTMKPLILCLMMLLAVAPAGLLQAQTTQPVTQTDPRELLARQAAENGNYAEALLIYQKIRRAISSDDPRAAAIDEQIRMCQRNLVAQSGANMAPQAAEPAETQQSLSAGRVPHEPPTEGQVRVLTIQQLGNFDYDDLKGGNIPDDVKALSGSRVRLRGFMLPLEQADRVTMFSLVPDLFACCFGQPPQIQHMVMVKCPPGKGVPALMDEIDVEGILTVEEKKDEGFIISIFELSPTSIKLAVK